jgi:hypothetical protein
MELKNVRTLLLETTNISFLVFLLTPVDMKNLVIQGKKILDNLI